MKRTFAILITLALCIFSTAAQNQADQHNRQHFGQHFSQHFGTNPAGHDRHRHFRADTDIHFGTGIYLSNTGSRMLLDVVHLNDGSEIIGVITSMTPEQDIRLLTYDGSTYVFGMDEVRTVTKRYGRWSSMYRRHFRNQTNGSFHKPEGYMGIVEFGLAAMFTTENIRPSVNIINGYRICPQFAVGLGLGMNYYIEDAELGIPVFLHIRSDFFNRSRTPFFALNIGYQIATGTGDCHEGIILEPSFGYGFNVGNNQRLNISLGIACDNERSWYEYAKRYEDGADMGLSLKIGYAF